MSRPIYVLPLVENPQHVLLGWEDPEPLPSLSANEVGAAWWDRWVHPRAKGLEEQAAEASDLLQALQTITINLKA